MGSNVLRIMKKIKNIIILSFSLFYTFSAIAQTIGFDEKVDVGNGLYKVRSNERWGLIDKDDQLKLSVEYNEPQFLNGYAVITQFGTDQLVGVADSTGYLTTWEPNFMINKEYPFVSDGMLVVREKGKDKWGYLNIETGELLSVVLKGFKTKKNSIFKKLGFGGKDIKGVFVFDFVAPFVEGLAVVHTPQTGWHHIDKGGNLRFKDSDSEPTLFRTSVHNGESVIFNEKGIVLCKETPDGSAGIIKYITDTYDKKDYIYSVNSRLVLMDKKKLVLNDKYQADRYVDRKTGDSIIFIEHIPVVPVVEQPVDSFTLDRDIKVELSKNVISAGSKGTAAVTLNVSNVGEFASDALTVSVNVNSTKKNWEGVIPIGTTQQITLYIPAKFSASAITREVKWVIQCGNKELDGTEKVTIKRYKPSR